MINRKRLLFFDILRVISVAAIVIFHIVDIHQIPILSGSISIFNIEFIGLGYIGWKLLVFVSGAVLAYSHPKIVTFDEIGEFIIKRLVRIYPAVWITLIISIAFMPFFLAAYSPVWIFLEFTGFISWSGHLGGALDFPLWFIGLIVTLYFLFPLLAASIRKNPIIAILFIAVIQFTFRYLVSNGIVNLGPGGMSWFPLCNILEFSLGILIIQQGIFPKWINDSAELRFLADISFYVFLMHLIKPIVPLIKTDLILYFITVSLLSWMLMLADGRIQEWISSPVNLFK